MSEQGVAGTFGRSSDFGGNEHPVYCGRWSCAIQDSHLPTEGTEFVPANVWIVVARNQVDKDVLQLLKVLLDDKLTLMEILGILYDFGCFPVAQIRFQSLPQDGWAVFAPRLEHAGALLETALLVCAGGLRDSIERQSLFPYLGDKVLLTDLVFVLLVFCSFSCCERVALYTWSWSDVICVDGKLGILIC